MVVATYVPLHANGKLGLEELYCLNSRQMNANREAVIKSLICRTKPTNRTIQVWTEEASSALQDCFKFTDWGVFKADTDLEEYIASVLSYMQFYADVILPTK